MTTAAVEALPTTSTRITKFLTIFNVAVPIALLSMIAIVAAFGLDVGGFSIGDVLLYVLSWSWIIITPFTVTAALIMSSRPRQRELLGLNIAVGMLWALTVVGLALMPLAMN